MGKSLYTSISNIPRGFILALGMIIVFECCLAFVPKHKMSDPPYEQEALAIKGRLVDSANGFNALVVGDCTGWAAIKPLTLESKLGCTVFNLCVNGAQTYLMSYILLKRYLANCHRPPDTVILQLSANTLLYLYGMNDIALKDYILPWFRMDDDFIEELNPDLRRLCLKYQILKTIPSFRNQFFLKKKGWFLKLFQPTRNKYERIIRYYHEQKGFYNEDFDPGKRKIDQITDIGENYKQFIVSEFNLSYIHKILKLLEEKEIRVVVCTSPVRNDELRIWKEYRLRPRLMNFARNQVRPFGNVAAFWDLSDAASNPNNFVDKIHLNEAGAEKYSRVLAEKIKRETPLR